MLEGRRYAEQQRGKQSTIEGDQVLSVSGGGPSQAERASCGTALSQIDFIRLATEGGDADEGDVGAAQCLCG